MYASRTFCLSNIIEKVIASRFILHIENNAIIDKFQSSYKCLGNCITLIIYGIAAAKPERTAQCKISVRAFFINHRTRIRIRIRMSLNFMNFMNFMNFTNQESTGIDFIMCHRLHTTRQNAVKPIIVRFKNSSDGKKSGSEKQR